MEHQDISLFDFLFVWDRRRSRFVERFWVGPAGREANDGPPDLDEMDGAISALAANAMDQNLRDDYPEPDYAVVRSQGSTWSDVATRFQAGVLPA